MYEKEIQETLRLKIQIFSKLLDKTILNHMVYHCSKRWGNLNLIQIALHPACTSGSRNHSSVAVVVVFVCGF